MLGRTALRWWRTQKKKQNSSRHERGTTKISDFDSPLILNSQTRDEFVGLDIKFSNCPRFVTRHLSLFCGGAQHLSCFWSIWSPPISKVYIRDSRNSLNPLRPDIDLHILHTVHYTCLRSWQEKLVWQSRASVCDHFLYSRVNNLWFRDDVVGRN